MSARGKSECQLWPAPVTQFQIRRVGTWADWVSLSKRKTMKESSLLTTNRNPCVRASSKLNGIMEHYENLINRHQQSSITQLMDDFFSIFYFSEMACLYCVNVSSNDICNRYAIEMPCPTGTKTIIKKYNLNTCKSSLKRFF
jgi:hypothetical protein